MDAKQLNNHHRESAYMQCYLYLKQNYHYMRGAYRSYIDINKVLM